MTRKIKLVILYVILAAAVAFGQTRAPHAKVAPDAARLNFNRDIAPIIFHSCAECHHPGGPAPFSLLDYEDVRKRAKQIAVVTRNRYMPPYWYDA